MTKHTTKPKQKKRGRWQEVPICPYTGRSTDERISDICKYNCTMQSKCPLNCDDADPEFEDDEIKS